MSRSPELVPRIASVYTHCAIWIPHAYPIRFRIMVNLRTSSEEKGGSPLKTHSKGQPVVLETDGSGLVVAVQDTWNCLYGEQPRFFPRGCYNPLQQISRFRRAFAASAQIMSLISVGNFENFRKARGSPKCLRFSRGIAADTRLDS